MSGLRPINDTHNHLFLGSDGKIRKEPIYCPVCKREFKAELEVTIRELNHFLYKNEQIDLEEVKFDWITLPEGYNCLSYWDAKDAGQHSYTILRLSYNESSYNEVFIKVPAENHPQGGWYHEAKAHRVSPREVKETYWHPYEY